jgi:hypothetical protein
MYQINKKKMFCDIADNFAIVINSETGIYYGINSFGTSVFEHLLKGAAPADILAELHTLDGVPSDMEQRLTDFVEELKNNEIIIDGTTTKNKIITSKVESIAPIKPEIAINPELAEADEFILDVTEYSDAQELLLADPIHDVEEELGWQPVLQDIEATDE